MNHASIEKIAQAVLYEGYILYPYRPSVKNQHRWTFGGLYPQAYCEAQKTGDASSFITECIVLGSPATTLQVGARFLHLIDRRVGQYGTQLAQWRHEQTLQLQFVESLEVNGKKYQHWQEATERQVSVPAVSLRDLLAQRRLVEFSFPAGTTQEDIRDAAGHRAAVLFRKQREISGTVELSAEQLGDGAYKITARVANGTVAQTTDRDAALMHALVSTHAILSVENGSFVSMTDPPDALKEAAATCRNVGVWPVLVGDAGQTDAMLASPIILYDYPQIAPESPGDLFDGGEIDEILSLRIMTLTDEEKRDVAAIDERADAMLQRTERLAREQLMNLHGTMRSSDPLAGSDIIPVWDPLADRPKLPSVKSGGVDLHPGDRVRLCPRGGADAFDLVLAGKIATIAVIEQDYEDRIHLAVTIDDDPGSDFGRAGKPGHRFFFRPDEVEPVYDDAERRTTCVPPVARP